MARVTFVNGRWQGKIAPSAERSEEGLNSCPEVWDYLQLIGELGWELVSAVDSAGHFQFLFLKRAKDAIPDQDPGRPW
jgi:hypothetical protein